MKTDFSRSWLFVPALRRALVFLLIMNCTHAIAAPISPAKAASPVTSEVTLSGLRTLRLIRLNGIPVLAHEQSLDEQAYFRLIGLGIKPNLMRESDTEARNYAAEFLPANHPLLGRNADRWPGRNEFEQQDAQQAFLREYSDKLLSLVPRLPLDLYYNVTYDLPQYDKYKGGFELPSAANAVALQALHTGGALKVESNISEKPLTWKLSEQDARQILLSLQSLDRESPRRVRLLFRLTADGADVQTFTLHVKMKSVEIYNSSLTTKLAEVDLGNKQQAVEREPNSLAKLANPSLDIKPLRFRSIRGVPMFELRDQARTVFRLLGAANVEEYFDRPNGSAVELARSLLTDQAQRTILIPYSYVWLGRNEFEVARSRERFTRVYLPQLQKIAPSLPFEFAYVEEGVIERYDDQNGGLALGPDSALKGFELKSEISGAGLVPDFQFDWPKPIWKASRPEAERIFSRLKSRDVRYVSILQAVSLDGTSGTVSVRLKSVRIYNPEMDTELYSFGVQNDAPSAMTSDTSQAAKRSSTAPLDDQYFCVKLFAQTSADSNSKAFDQCWDNVAKLDAEYYAGQRRLPSSSTEEGYVPFFPRIGAERTEPNRRKFVAWLRAQSTALPSKVTLDQQRQLSEIKNRDRYTLFPGNSLDSDDRRQILAQQKLQNEQVVDGPRIGNTQILFVLPNRVDLYSVDTRSLPRPPQGSGGPILLIRSELEQSDVSTFKAKSERDYLLLRMTPVRTQVRERDRGTALLNSDFSNVPRLQEGVFVSKPVGSQAKARTGPYVLNGALIDLLAAKFGGNSLSAETKAYLVLRRWYFENDNEAQPDARFFVIGKRKPNLNEAVELGDTFLTWAGEHAPALPFQFSIDTNVELKKDQAEIAWNNFSCFDQSYGFMRNDHSIFSAASYEALQCERNNTRAEGSPKEQRVCELAPTVSEARRYFYGVHGQCKPEPSHFEFADPLNVRIRFSEAIAAPKLSIVGDKKKLGLSAKLSASKAEFSAKEPLSVDILPAESTSYFMNDVKRGSGEFLTINVILQTLSFRDDEGNEISQTALRKNFTPSIPTAVATPRESEETNVVSKPYGPDLLGIRLGMSFEEADRIVRGHMRVGQVFDGVRTLADQSKRNMPLTSGRLYLSEDEREMIALNDEPPAAAGRVLVAWRRLEIPRGTTDFPSIFKGLQEKYGKPVSNWNQSGSLIQWAGSTGKRCTSFYDTTKAVFFQQYWQKGGMPLNFNPNLRQSPQAPSVLIALLDPLEERNRQWANCGPFVTAYHWDAGQTNNPDFDQLDMTLTDFGAYSKSFAESRRLTQQSGGREGGSPIKF